HDATTAIGPPRALLVFRDFFFQAEDGIRDFHVTGVQTCALPILKPNRIVDIGIARTFQNLRLFNNLTVLQNVLIAQHHRLRTFWPASVLRTPGHLRQRRRMHEVALEKLAFFGPRLMSFRLQPPVEVLSYANRRRTEMARAMATGARLLLLDE